MENTVTRKLTVGELLERAPSLPPLMDAETAWTLLGLTDDQFYYRVRRRDFPFVVRHGRRVHVVTAELLRYLGIASGE